MADGIISNESPYRIDAELSEGPASPAYVISDPAPMDLPLPLIPPPGAFLPSWNTLAGVR